MLVGREAELKFLNNYYTMNGNHIIVVYGQKGVGKTTLLKNFAKDYNSTYYQARSCSEREQRYQWGNELGKEGYALPPYPSYTDLLDALIPKEASDKHILIIDEFHHFVKGDELFMSKLIQYIQTCPKQCLVLLCTSASGWVENSMIQKIGALASSLSGLLKVRGLKFQDMKYLFPQYDKTQSMLIYAALGGIPGLWNSFFPNMTAKENIIYHLINKDSRLYREMSVFMAEELREPAVYNTLLATMAKGCTKLNELYLHTGFSRAKISVYLKNLMEIDLVEKMYSFESDGYANTKKGIYHISNPYVRFYFHYLFPNQSKLQEISPREFFHEFVEDSYPDFVEEAYRKVCKEYMSERYKTVGEWIGKTGNLDIVAKDSDGKIVVCACSYAHQMTYEDFEGIVFHMEQAKIQADTVIMFCEKGFDENLQEISRKANVILQGVLID